MASFSSLRRRLLSGSSKTSVSRLHRAAWLQVVVFLIGTIGYRVLGEGEYSWLSCAYMTVITITTVGYDETLPVTGDPVMMIFTMILVIVGMGTVLYFVTAMAAFMVDGELRDLIGRWRMDRKVASLRGHIIIGGLGATGSKIVPDLLASHKECVLVDKDEETIQNALKNYDVEIPYVVGDMTDDDVLREAGIEHAAGLAFCLGDDRENLFATLSARRLNDRARIVVRGADPRSEQKFLTAGADRVIYIDRLGGMRLAGELIHPGVTNVLEVLLRDYTQGHQFHEIFVPPESPLVGRTLGGSDWRRQTGSLVVAALGPSGEHIYNPTADYEFLGNTKLVVLAGTGDLPIIERFVRGVK